MRDVSRRDMEQRRGIRHAVQQTARRDRLAHVLQREGQSSRVAEQVPQDVPEHVRAIPAATDIEVVQRPAIPEVGRDFVELRVLSQGLNLIVSPQGHTQSSTWLRHTCLKVCVLYTSGDPIRMVAAKEPFGQCLRSSIPSAMHIHPRFFACTCTCVCACALPCVCACIFVSLSVNALPHSRTPISERLIHKTTHFPSSFPIPICQQA
jgi:hypothetical protein